MACIYDAVPDPKWTGPKEMAPMVARCRTHGFNMCPGALSMEISADDVLSVRGYGCDPDETIAEQAERIAALEAALHDAVVWFDTYRPQTGPGTMPSWVIDAKLIIK